MKLLRAQPWAFFVLALVLGILLPALAVLQYRWLDELGQREGERMRHNLEAACRRFAEDFDREITRAYLSLQIVFLNEPEEDRGRAIANRLKQWRASAADPELIADIYWASPDSGGLEKFERDTGRLRPAAWPPDFVRLRERLMGATSDPPPPLMDAPTALLIPALNARMTELPRGSLTDRFAGYLIVLLDRGRLLERFLPELSRRYFSSLEGFDYQVLIRDSAGDPLFASDTRARTAGLDSADGGADFFRLRSDFFFHPMEMVRMSGEGEAPKDAGRTREGLEPNRFALRIIQREGEDGGSRLFFSRHSTGLWRLDVRHRSGSVQAAVARARGQNLVVSFVILLLLAASGVAVFVSSRRSQRLAHRQMEFVAGVSHEMRTPLAVVGSAADNLADGLVDTPEKARQYGELIRKECRRLSEMVEKALELAGIQSGRRSVELQEVELNALLREVVGSWNAELEQRGIRLDLSLAEDLPPVLTDGLALRSAVGNLISNAVKYAAGGKWIGVRSACDSAGNLTISVEDRGPGIDSRERELIFDPFYRGRQATEAQIPGSGLGLSLVRRWMESMGGQVSLHSPPAGGCRLTLHLPASAERRKTALPRGAPA